MATSQLFNVELADALKLAREIATENNRDEAIKRPHDNSDGEIPSKRASYADMSGNPIAALGGNMTGMDPVVIEQFEVPDNCVGLIIGRGGESISNIQNQTGCRIQMSQNGDGTHKRSCTLTGTKAAIDKAKEFMQQIIDKSGGNPPPNKAMAGLNAAAMAAAAGGGRMLQHEMLIPASKCGLVIGKGGETIKQLQEKAQVKMVMIQETTQATGMPKPLRIIGEPDKVEFAKRLVEEVITKGEDVKGMMNDYGAAFGGVGKNVGEVMIIVPRTAVGVIIGKGGENIRRLTQDTGAKVQFKTGEDQNAVERTAIIQGTPDQIQKATQLITDMVNRAVTGGADGVGGPGGGGGGGYRKQQGGEADIFYMHVPAAKTGLVIGKGGETIKQINAESGARVELSRDPQPNDFEKIFVIRGTSQQIHHAQHLIRVRVGDIPANTPVPPFPGNTEQQFNYPNYAANQSVGDPNTAAWAAYYSQYYQQGAAPQSYPQAAAAPTGQPTQATNASSAPAINPQTGQPDYSAQWAEYYRSLGMHEQAAMIEQQARANQQAAAVAAPAQAANVAAQVNGYAYGQQSQYGYGQQPTAAPAGGGYQYPTQY